MRGAGRSGCVEYQTGNTSRPSANSLSTGLWPWETPPEMGAGSLSMHDMALQPSQYYTTDDEAAALSAIKPSNWYPQPVRQKSIQSNCMTYDTQAPPKCPVLGDGNVVGVEERCSLP